MARGGGRGLPPAVWETLLVLSLDLNGGNSSEDIKLGCPSCREIASK